MTHTLSLCRLLIGAGADVNARDARGATPFLVSCAAGRVDIIQLLLERGADPTLKDDTGMDAAKTAEFHKKLQV